MFVEWFMIDGEVDASEDDIFDDDGEGATDVEKEPTNKVLSSRKRKRTKRWTGFNRRRAASKDAAEGAFKKIYGTGKKPHGASLIDQLSETKQLVSDVFHLSLKNARAAIHLRKLSLELDVLEQQMQLPSSLP
jgi:hypothetical protein